MGGTCTYQYYDIQSCQACLIVPKTFTYQALDSISDNGCFNLPFGNCQTKPGNILTIVSCKHAEIGITCFDRAIKYELVFRRI